MKELNYFPNDVARSLFNKRTNLIGAILPTTSNPFFGELAFQIETICNSLGYKKKERVKISTYKERYKPQFHFPPKKN